MSSMSLPVFAVAVALLTFVLLLVIRLVGDEAIGWPVVIGGAIAAGIGAAAAKLWRREGAARG